MKSNRHSEYRAKWKAFDKSSSFPFELNPVAEKCHFEEDSKLIFVLIIFDSLKVSFLLVSCFSLATSSSKFNFSFNKSKTLSAKPACVAFLLHACSPVHSFRHNTKCFWKEGLYLLSAARDRQMLKWSSPALAWEYTQTEGQDLPSTGAMWHIGSEMFLLICMWP